MAAQKPPQKLLHELLAEDQEPFYLYTYIADPPRKRSHAPCFLYFQSKIGLDLTKSPFVDLNSEVTLNLHVPSTNPIQKQRKSMAREQNDNSGSGLFASLLTRLWNRRRNRKRCYNDVNANISRSSLSRLSGEVCSESNEDKSKDPEAVAVATPTPQEENCQPRNSKEEQSSPVSTLEPVFDDQNGHGRGDLDVLIDNYDQSSNINYKSLQKVKQQLLYRIQRFEKLAQLDPIELDKLAEDEQEAFAQSDYESIKLGSAFERSGFWNDVEFDTADEKGRCKETVEEITGEIELGIYEMLVEELWEE